MSTDHVMCPSCGVPSGPCLDIAGRIVPTHAARLRELAAATRPPKPEQRRTRTGAVKRYKPRHYDSRDAAARTARTGTSRAAGGRGRLHQRTRTRPHERGPVRSVRRCPRTSRSTAGRVSRASRVAPAATRARADRAGLGTI